MIPVPGTAIDILWLLPEMLLTFAGCAVLLLGQSERESLRRSVPWVALLAVIAAIGVVTLGQFVPADAALKIHNGLIFDGLTDFVRRSALIVGVLIILVNWSTASAGERGEFFAMALFTLAGLLFVGASANLVMLFLAIELVGIPTYIMVTLSRWNAQSLEAGTKYFYLGALSAAVTAYGFTFLYGVAGSATMDQSAIDAITKALSEPGTLKFALASLGLAFSIGGLLFKLSAFPMHAYVADVYEGAASPVAGLLGFVPKFAGVIAIAKVLAISGWTTTSGGLFWFLWIVAALSMTLGNVLAFRQGNVKRMLAYSGIAHGGYMVLGLMAGASGDGGSIGATAVMYYVVVYGIANLGAFALLALLEVRGESVERVSDLAGLLRRSPGPALLMALAMFALMGMPPTPGFWGKMGLFGSLLAVSNTAPEHQTWIVTLVVIAAINSAIGAAYYLRVIAACLLYENDDAPEPAPREAQHMGALLCGFLTLLFALFPSVLMRASEGATSAFLNKPTISARSTPKNAANAIGETPTVADAMAQ